MSQPAKLQEPTMEEILASIRRIIAEDDLRPPPPPPPPDNQAPAESAPIPAAVESALPDEMVDGFDDPEVSTAAANDAFEQRESPWRPNEDVGAGAWETPEPATPEPHLDSPEPVESLAPPRFAAAQPEPAPPEPARDLPSREPARLPRFEPFRSEAAKTEFAKLELARSDFARAQVAESDAAKSEPARPDHARPDPAKPELPRFELPRRDAARSEAARRDSQEAARPQPARASAAASPPVLRAAAEDGLLSPRTTAAVDLAFNTLAQTVLVQNSRTLEELVREMLKPMLRAWLDDNLPGLVERLVRAEIERVSRGRS
jgi:cell pole-organizing protein PopZ